MEFLRKTHIQKQEGRLSLGFTYNFDLVFNVILFSKQMKMLLKIIDCKCLWNSQGNVYVEVCFSKVASLQSTNSYFTLKTSSKIFFRNMFPKLAILKRIFWEKSLQFASVFKTLWLVVRSLQFDWKTKLFLDLS